MKILLIDVNYKYSSTGKLVHDLHNSLRENGHDVVVCYGRGPLVNEEDVYKFSGNLETYAHAFLTRVTGITGNYSYFSTKNLIKIIEEFNPDVVHIHELHAYFVNIAPLINYLKQKNIKTVWTFHCEFMYTGKCGHAYNCEKWKTECKKCPQVREYPKSLFFDFTNKMFNEKKKLFDDFEDLTIVAPSKWLADRVRQSFLKEKDIRVIHNGVDTENLFYPRSYEHLKVKHNIKEEKIILAVAPDLMSERKGGRWVLELAKAMKFDKNKKFILIGVEDLNERFDENVIALGRTNNQQELAEYYSMADFTLLTSEKETFSLICAESLACGTPIIGFESGAPSEIAPSGFGLFVPYGDLDSLINVTESVINNSIRLKASNLCKNFAKQNYSNDNMVSSYSVIYNEIFFKKGKNK